MDNYRYNPFKNKQLRIQMLSIFGIFAVLSVGIAAQGVDGWWIVGLVGIGAGLFMWVMSYIMRNNP